MVLSENREVQEPQVPAGVIGGRAPNVAQARAPQRRKTRAMFARSANELTRLHGVELKTLANSKQEYARVFCSCYLYQLVIACGR